MRNNRFNFAVCPKSKSRVCCLSQVQVTGLLFVPSPSHGLISLVPWNSTASVADLETVAVNSPRILSLASGLRHNADIGLGCLPALRIELLRLFVRNGSGDDHVLARMPVHGRGDPVL